MSLSFTVSEQEAYERRVHEINAAYKECVQKCDWDTIKSFYQDDSIKMPPGHNCLHGIDGMYIII